MKANITSLLLAAFLIASCSKPGERSEISSAETDEIRSEIQELENAYAKAVNDNNTGEIMKYYAEDAISYNSDGPPLKGKDAIRTDIRRLSTDFPETAKISFTVQEVLPSADKFQVVEIGRYEIKDNAGIAFGSGNYFSLFEKRGGKYVCIRDMQTPDTPKTKKKL
ncbi:YybH family protein [Flavobacterium selenitireducens]|uniref:YybH family protein n=1 Tax=Flavobacterium selenitireducens TaxID=2722704 RepID=UPI00168A8ACD|nr:nuclear transport factor 2 family protein [Flavobacterium selenitireducens]MBD3582265.1 nuclear transport factor 2 family protein [Flavobacterium selenitireducens]